MTVGATSTIKTKKSLKALKGTAFKPWNFVETSLFGTEMPDEDGSGRFTVVGPDAFRSRKWFAEVVVKDGVITKVS